MQTMILDDVQETQIFRPKPKRLIKSKKHISKIRTSSNKAILAYHLDNINKEKSLNLDKISLEEMQKDFIMLNQVSEEELFYKEIMHIINRSNKLKKKSCFSDEINHKIAKKPKRINEKA